MRNEATDFKIMFRIFLLTVACVWMLGLAAADEAREITTECSYKGCNAYHVMRLCDGDQSTACTVSSGRALQISHPEGISGVSMAVSPASSTAEIQVKNEQGDWVKQSVTGEYLYAWYELPEGTTEFRVVSTQRKKDVKICELKVYGAGEVPAAAPRWEKLEKADIMLIVAHPDDELLWFGGLLPTYAGERKLRVQVVYVTAWNYRKLELLNGLWTCGVKYYPTILDLRDEKLSSIQSTLDLWGRDRFAEQLVAVIRQYRPQVVLTHAFNGEYGHNAHRATALKVSEVVKSAALDTRWPASAAAYGTWQVKKLYIHLYEDNQIHLDWTQPLSAFNGESSISVATRALDCHLSQTTAANPWSMSRADEYDNGLFGLYFTTVGKDESGTDIMEHIEEDE